jgi:hypothetical protein
MPKMSEAAHRALLDRNRERLSAPITPTLVSQDEDIEPPRPNPPMPKTAPLPPSPALSQPSPPRPGSSEATDY